MKYKVIILGAGGHARVLIDCLGASRDCQIEGILDPRASLVGQKWADVIILGNDELLQQMQPRGVDYFIVGVGGTGDNSPRKRLFELARSHGLKPLMVKHETAVVSPYADIGEGCQLLPGCIINTGARLGSNVIINSGAIIEHDCILGDHVHVATGAKMASTVQVKEGAHIGIGATIRQGLTIGEYSLVGAGAVVVKDVPPGVVVVGVPAHLRNLAESSKVRREAVG